MNRDELESKVSLLVAEALEANIKSLDIIAVLESCKISVQIIMHENIKHTKVT